MESKILNALGIDPAFIFLFMLILFVVLFILYVNVTMKYNRLQEMEAYIRKNRSVSNEELQQLFNISVQTLRRDLKELEDRYSQRFASRVTGYYGKLEFLGRDVRVQKRLQKAQHGQGPKS